MFNEFVAVILSVTFVLAFGEAGKGGELTHDETTIIQGALDHTEKTALDPMNPSESTFSLDINTKLEGYVHLFTLEAQKFHHF
ncbi:hypothetical protein KC19_1G307600 [Ceratodon purpureus]|uniref:Uncharacterized protein n=1 Tax=Ceratodon purpureus TaxID=3225 RepID=A0A8T0JEP3_CERPU|nr:hypothetical protein KC19_1G307600 [Ceratodon purpureus]